MSLTSFVGWSLLFSLVVGLWFALEHLRRGAVAAFLRARPDVWVPTGDLARIFGQSVYETCRWLHGEGMLECEPTETPGVMRAGAVSYRWRQG